MKNPVDFSQISAPRPEYSQMAGRYEGLQRQWEQAADTDQRSEVIRQWDDLCRESATWENLVDLRFNQDTGNELYRQEREYRDELRPRLINLDVQMKRRILASPDRGELEQRWGRQAFELWQCDILAFDPQIEADLVEEAKLEAQYNERLAAAKLTFRGEEYNFSALGRFHSDADRKVRYESNHVRWQWFADNRQTLDEIYAQLVQLRHRMARTLKFKDFVELGYRRMKRIDYGQQDVDRFRAAVRKHVVPLVTQLRARQAERLGIDRVMFWDEGIFDAQGNPKPQGEHDWMVERARQMFDAMGKELGEFFRIMIECRLMDLKNRPGKAGGGFCTDFPSYGLPFIFANFNGTKGDVEVVTHEIGHAFQFYCSRDKPLSDYLFPTYESCEIHSMGLEFLTWPHMELFFGEDAERFRRIHLMQSLMFLPYGVAVDHFQHLVYADPSASAQQRHAMWREMERTYLPWRDAGDLPHVDQGGQWQWQRHIYLSPFYYIDYTLALTCALQLWTRSRTDPGGTLSDYVALCRRGGEAPFQQLAQSAGLTSPFQEDCLEEVVRQARDML